MGLLRNQFCGTLGGARAIHVGQVWFLAHVFLKLLAHVLRKMIFVVRASFDQYRIS